MGARLDLSGELAYLGETCARMGSPFFGSGLRHAAAAYDTDPVLRDLLDRHASRSRLGLRLGAAAHFRALRGQAREIALHYPSTGGDGDARAAWHAVLSDVRAHSAEYDALMAQPVQTNEVARAMPVLGAMLALADAVHLPVRVYEIASSAGLLLNLDRYRYSGEGWTWGDAASRVHLRNETQSGAPPNLQADLRIVERHGVDLRPLNAASPDDADRLLSFVWPDQSERFQRLRAAIAVARRYPPEVCAGDGIAYVRAKATPLRGTVTVVLHTVFTEHLTPGMRAQLGEAIDEFGSRATQSSPVAWIRMEPGERNYDTLLTLWPGAAETFVCRSDGHAQHLRWSA